MALERIEVQDYQSLEDVDLTLGQFTIIVGPSGSGKSALIRALKALAFNQVGHRFIRHGSQKARVRLTLDGGKVVEWEKPRDKSATYTDGHQVYTRTGRAVPEEIENVLGIRRIDIDKGVAFTPQFHSQHDLPLLLTESSTLAARALAKLTKLSLLVEAQMDCRRDQKRAQRSHEAAEEEVERTRGQLDQLPNVRRARNLLERAGKLVQTINRRLSIVRQADDIVQDIAGSLLIADLTLPHLEEIEALEQHVKRVERVVDVVIEAEEREEASEAAARAVEEAEIALVGIEDQYQALIDKLGACPLCGSTETWGKHEH